uniref:Uncharacterized protein n=1 Tax=Utricularia reniformis TaxID=192314 RepID=A0A1Y0B2K0_9LAMI|nr:hypothetical protein AEK19_MT1420 [Utricularia reniformis]ART31614.1 hypothetical protein AEK19_MT1420 [Utricularia reniformis]
MGAFYVSRSGHDFLNPSHWQSIVERVITGLFPRTHCTKLGMYSRVGKSTAPRKSTGRSVDKIK